MRYSQAEKMEIIRVVEASDLPVKRTLEELDVPRSSFYRWYERYLAEGGDGLADHKPGPQQFWNRILCNLSVWCPALPEAVSHFAINAVLASAYVRKSPTADAAEEFPDPCRFPIDALT